MKRPTLIKIHLYLSGVSLIFMCLMAISGSLHLFVGDEGESVEEIKSLSVTTPVTKNALVDTFKDELKKIAPNYTYDYIKGSKSFQMSRPTTRTYYTIKLAGESLKIEKHVPAFRKSLMELHKGHGPKSSRPILGLLGVIVFGAVLSGLWLGWSAKAFRKTTLLTVVSGFIIYFGLYLL